MIAGSVIMEEFRIERLKQKILRFNGLMEELSQEFSVIYLEGVEDKLHDLVLEMMISLDKAREMVKKVSDLVLGKRKGK
ncbi:MAG: hypothetical protein ACFE9S_15045 [Candidatus Hermodarchaeota archaeon]